MSVVTGEFHIGTFPHVPPYNQSELYCSTNKKDDMDNSEWIIIGASAGGAILGLLALTVFVVIYFVRLAKLV